MISRRGEGEGDFWAFSTELYARRGVDLALLELQDQDGLQVNLVLFCLFAASRGQSLEGVQIAAMQDIGRRWGRGVVTPLREARRGLKALPAGAELRLEVKRLELAAEKAMQSMLEAILPAGGRASGAARATAEANLRAWFQEEGLLMTEARSDLFAAVLDAAFGDKRSG